MLLPTGFSFAPTEEELIINYLRPKVHNDSNAPWLHNIPEENLYSEKEPPVIAPRKGVYYFYNKLRKTTNGGKNFKRTVGRNGTWRGDTKDARILSSDGSLIGYKRTFSYRIKKQPTAYKDENDCKWLMTEYALKKDSDQVLSVIRKLSSDERNTDVDDFNNIDEIVQSSLETYASRDNNLGHQLQHIQELTSDHNVSYSQQSGLESTFQQCKFGDLQQTTFLA